ncbi:MAG: redoxin domain-containing protein [Candidatus Ratteibacteria bacterium]
MINFFATWCEPCKREIPSLNKFYEKFSTENLFMVGVSSEKMAEIEKFLEENKINFNVAIDDGEIEKKFAIEVYPATVVIDGDGKIVSYITGAIYNPDATLEPAVKTAVATIQSGKGISKEEFLKQSKIQSPYGLKYKEEKRELTEQEKRIAKQIYCPRGCGKNLIECDCSMCREAIEEMKEEIKKGTSEKEIVKKINTRYCSVKDD